jgi:hypothetical protein
MTQRRMVRSGLVAGGLGLLLSLIGAALEPRQAFASYLTAYAAGLSLAVGAIILVMISQLTGARWFLPFRPVTLRIGSTLPLFALLFLLLIPGLHTLYPWVPPLDDSLSPELRHQIAQKRAYLNVPGFLLRAAIYFLVWIGFGRLLRRRPGVASAAGLPLVALTLTFAAFDWLMSLTPGWFSTIYGVYYFAGGFLGALGLVALLGFAGSAENPAGIAEEQYHSLGKLLLTFVLFWAYVAYAQLLIVWIADLPIEVTWYSSRLRGSWGVLGLILLGGQFLVPFVLLLFRRITSRGRSLAWIGGWLVLMHYLDVYWLVLPAMRPGGLQLHWLDLAGLLVVAGFASAYGAWRSPEGLAPVAAATRPEGSYAV